MAVRIESVDISKISIEFGSLYTELMELNIPQKEDAINSLKNELEVTITELKKVEDAESESERKQKEIIVKYPRHSKGKYEYKRKFFPKLEYGNNFKQVFSVFGPILLLLLVFGIIGLLLLLF